MKPHDEYGNGDESGSGEGSEEEGDEVLVEVEDAGAPARALRALNALRKSRQHYDVLLRAAGGGGAHVPAHRAVLAAHAPYLLQALATPESPPAPAPAPAAPPPVPVYRVEGVTPDALAALVEYMYTGRLAARGGAGARALYRAAWRLRLEAAAAALADRLLRRPRPQDCLELRALPDLPPHHLHMLDAYIAHNFDDICASGALSALPLIRIELLRPASGAEAAEAPLAVAEAALAFLRDHHADAAVEEVCARAHLVYVDEAGALRDCGELPAARGDAPELQEYRRAAEQRRAGAGGAGAAGRPAGAAPGAGAGRRPLPALELGARRPRPDTAVLAARGADTNGGGGRRVTRALVSLRGRLAAARVSCAAAGAPGGGGEGGARAGDTRASLAAGRCAGGAAALGARLVVCGGYDRARVLRSAEAYDPATNEWSALPDMRSARARFPAACLAQAVYAFGGSDGQNELDSVDVYEERVAAGGGVAVGLWAARARMPLARSHAAAAACADTGALYVVGGWAGGRSLPHVARYTPAEDAWRLEPPLEAPRSQCAAAAWRGQLWALGGCDAWHCLASTERLRLGEEGAVWQAGPALPAARRSAGAAAWRGRLVLAGGSDGAASLRRTDWLLPPPDTATTTATAQVPEGGDPEELVVWAGGPPLRRARAALGLAAVGDVLYAVGGFDGKEFLSCVECLYAPEGEWTALCAPPPPRPAPAQPAHPAQPPEIKDASKGDEKEATKQDENGGDKVTDGSQPGEGGGKGNEEADRGAKGEGEREGEVKVGCPVNGASA